ncbi:MAG: Coenzyme F420 hydrogenase/dehydrogenase, beta subunit C-terminal domain [Ruminococcus sp.]
MKKTYLGYNTDDNIRKNSSSGGLFYELAISVLNQSGVIYGAAFNENFEVNHIRVTDKKQLEKLLCSKYVQSKMNNIYSMVAKDLQEKHKVLFSGTPCQIYGLKTLLGKMNISTEQLITVDFICHGVPSPKVWKSYLEYLSNNGEIAGVSFRHKNHGWHDFSFHISYKNGKTKSVSHELDPYMRGFLSDKNIRPSCYRCPFKDKNYLSDITMGDAWKVEKDKPQWADDKGTSLFIVRTEKGQNLINSISESFLSLETDYEKWTAFNPSIVYATDKAEGRSEFFEDFNRLSTTDFWKKYKKVPFKKSVKYKAKQMLKILHLEKLARRFV